jgi:hypothetical protein
VIIRTRQQALHILAARLFLQNILDLGNRLWIELTLYIHVRQRPMRHTDARKLDAVTAAVQALKLALDRGIRGLRFKGALHVPDRVVELVFFISNDAHAHICDKIIREHDEHAREDIHRIRVALIFQIRLAKQAVGFQMFREGFQDMFAMRDRFIQMIAVDHRLNFAVIRPKGYFRHEIFCSCIAGGLFHS